ncbi:PH domain-containing protein [Shewanella sp. WXL01]|uniref:PH domain-containing protein n=1 Tax=Shewanella sp. WXL01 TaxID=2709721 RepID=UPI00143859C2|nr:PH domain-containing protein [Shewanella sp. WXL01]NKF49890.1 PH domain-containing protein [Shewanella sp. WXL01]
MQEQTLLTATFHNKLATYWLTSGAVVLAITLVGIPLLLLWFPIGLLLTRAYINNMSAELTETKLIVRKGILQRTENTVPLDKITDLALIQGPLMRMYGIHKLTVETAGQSGAGALINLIGVNDVEAFRAKVLEQKQILNDKVTPVSSPNGQHESDQSLVYLAQMSQSLKNIEAMLANSQNKSK